MKKLLTLLIVFVVQVSFAQEKVVSGTVSDDLGPLSGVNVIKKGTTKGAETDFDGNYSLKAKKGDVLVFSFVGMQTVEKTVGNSNKINVVLKTSEHNTLEEVVVTASGIKKQKKSLGYAQQTVKSEELISSKQTDISNAMAGKISGVQLVGAPSSGFNTSSIRLRGDVGVLYVIDGVRTTNTNNLNSEDVESMSVLKGAAATALYGPEGKKGVVVITTTRAKKGRSSIVVDSAIEIGDATAYFPEMQEEYGGGYSMEFPKHTNGQPIVEYYADESWGPKLDGRLVRQWDSWVKGSPNYGKMTPWVFQGGVKEFFQPAVSTKNSVTFKKGGDDYRLKLNLQRNDRSLAIENAKRATNRLGVAFDFDVTKKLNVGANFIYTDMNTKNNPSEGYGSLGSNFFQWWQTQLDVKKLRKYKSNGKMLSWNIKGPSDPSPKYWDSPYVELYENLKNAQRHSVIGSVNLNYKLTDAFSVQASAKKTFVSVATDSRVAFGLLDQPAFSRSSNRSNRDLFTGALLYNKTFNKLEVSARLGGELDSFEFDSFGNESVNGLTIPGFYGIKSSKDRPKVRTYIGKDKSQAAYVTTSLGYDEWAFFEGSFRRDWSSRAALSKNYVDTKAGSLSLVLSKFIPSNDILSYWKLRGGYAEGAFFPNRYATYETYRIGDPFDGGSVLSVQRTLANSELTGASRTEMEIGTEMQLFRNKLSVDFTYFYKRDNNLPVQVDIDPTRGYRSIYSNEGIQSYKGFEVGLSATPVRTEDFKWTTAFNFATLDRYVDKVSNSTKTSDSRFLSDRWGGLILRNEEGKKWGRVYGNKVQEKNGKKVLNADGSYAVKSNQYLGNYLPDFTGGFINNFKYKNLSLGIDMDFQVGGKFFSITQMFMNYSGLGINTVGNNDKGNPVRNPVLDKNGNQVKVVKVADAGDKTGGTRIDGVDADGNAMSIYKSTQLHHESHQFGKISEFLYDASYLAVRNIRLGYTLDKDYTKSFGVDDLTVGVYMNNAFLLFESVPNVDPSQLEQAYGDSSQGTVSFMEGGQLPAVRTIGINLRLKF